MKKLLTTLAIVIFITSFLSAQKLNGVVVYARVIDGDTVPIVPLKEVNIYAFRIIKNKREARKLSKLIRNVKRVYPYAKIAGIKLRQYNDTLLQAETKRERRRIMKMVEDEIKEKYGDELRRLTISQGKILIKLIDRETGDTSFELVQELRGNLMAFFWQTFARVFGYNLKTRYDPEGEDRIIEVIIKMIENGQI